MRESERQQGKIGARTGQTHKPLPIRGKNAKENVRPSSTDHDGLANSGPIARMLRPDVNYCPHRLYRSCSTPNWSHTRPTTKSIMSASVAGRV